MEGKKRRRSVGQMGTHKDGHTIHSGGLVVLKGYNTRLLYKGREKKGEHKKEGTTGPVDIFVQQQLGPTG